MEIEFGYEKASLFSTYWCQLISKTRIIRVHLPTLHTLSLVESGLQRGWSDQHITPKDIEFAERAGCIYPKPSANASTMKMVVAGKDIKLCPIYIPRKAYAAFLQGKTTV